VRLHIFLCDFSHIGEKGTWAKKGVNFSARCRPGEELRCPPLRIPSPDSQYVAIVDYEKVFSDNGDYVLTADLSIADRTGTKRPAGMRYAIEDDLEWSPDSSAFFVTGSEGGEGPDVVNVYHLSDPQLTPQSIVGEAQRDMLRSFPPCRAKGADKEDCTALAAHPSFVNVVAVGWTPDSSAVALMGEMPCSSRFGGIACAVLGYEVDSKAGTILRRMEARQFASRWRASMAWKFRIPDPPEYEAQ